MKEAYENLTECISDPQVSIKTKLESICKTVKAISPNANRVSLWLFDKGFTEIYCLLCLDIANQTSNGQTLSRTEFQPYFEHILKNNILSASEARLHVATSCFNEAYFIPLDIHSLLDFVFHHHFKPTGIICCERQANTTEWLKSDINALRKVANLTSMFFSDEVLSIQGGKTMVLEKIGLH